MNPKVDDYLIDGCGRCPLGGTSNCKVRNWQLELDYLRSIVLDCGLTEELKWDMPCYTYKKSNILIMSAFKKYSALNFFKGSLLKDEHGILTKPGENSQASRQARFTSVTEIMEKEAILRAYIYEAVEVEEAGLKVKFKKSSEFEIPEEFQHKMDEIPMLNKVFNSLTPGRKRGYLLYFSAAKQSKTRESRIEKYIQKILDGKGLND